MFEKQTYHIRIWHLFTTWRLCEGITHMMLFLLFAYHMTLQLKFIMRRYIRSISIVISIVYRIFMFVYSKLEMIDECLLKNTKCKYWIFPRLMYSLLANEAKTSIILLNWCACSVYEHEHFLIEFSFDSLAGSIQNDRNLHFYNFFKYKKVSSRQKISLFSRWGQKWRDATKKRYKNTLMYLMLTWFTISRPFNLSTSFHAFFCFDRTKYFV